MLKNSPDRMPQIIPYLYYEDARVAIEFMEQEANLEVWLNSIRTIRRRYVKVEIVVPGHGEPGGSELLGQPLVLLEEEDQ